MTEYWHAFIAWARYEHSASHLRFTPRSEVPYTVPAAKPAETYVWPTGRETTKWSD